MTDIIGVLVGDMLGLLETAGERVIYRRSIPGVRDPDTRDMTEARSEDHHMPAALMEWRISRDRDSAPQQRTRDIIIAHHGWEPRDGDEIEIPREGRRYTVAGEAQGYTVDGGTVAWRLRTTDGR